MIPTPVEASVQQFEAGLRGTLLRPGDAEYDAARRVFNGMILRTPVLIARCAGVADVVRAVNFARDHDLLVAVRGGAHNVAGHGTCDGGLVIDLSRLRGVRVDPVRRVAWAEPGCTYADLDHETCCHGLATTGGTVASTGIAGLTLGGGLGFLMGTYGLACDNLRAADVVLADGRFLTASLNSHADLFWGLRGGGGNFGVVTSFVYQLHPVGTLLGGLLLYPFDRARDALLLFREVTATAPDELTCAYAVLTLPDGPRVALIAACWNGPLDRGEAVVRQLRTGVPPLDDGIRPLSYPQVQRLFEEIPFGLQNYWKGHFLLDLPDAAVEAIAEYAGRITSDHSAILIEAPHGAVSRVGSDESAYSYRADRYNASALAIWEEDGHPERHIEWARGFAAALQPFSRGGVYVSYLSSDAGRDQVLAAYGAEKYERLAALKTKYDPTNLFRLNQNILPELADQPIPAS
jgi:FAD/FMN-containing dehydrogenase